MGFAGHPAQRTLPVPSATCYMLPNNLLRAPLAIPQAMSCAVKYGLSQHHAVGRICGASLYTGRVERCTDRAIALISASNFCECQPSLVPTDLTDLTLFGHGWPAGHA